MENPTTWLLIVVFGGFWLVTRVLEKILAELKAIHIFVEEIEKRGKPPLPNSIEEWQSQRVER